MARWGTYQEVAHAFAHNAEDGPYYAGRQPSGSPRMFWEEWRTGLPALYSYGRHFCIAALRTLGDGRTVVLLTTRTYSVTTSKQTRIVAQAVSHRDVLYVANPLEPRERDWEEHAEEIERRVASAKRARSADMMSVHERAALSALVKANALHRAFGFGRFLSDPFSASAEVRARREELAARERVKREADFAATEAARLQWLEGGASYVHMADGTGCRWGGMDPEGYAYARRAGDELETSLGARVPWEHAVKVFRFIAKVRPHGKVWTPQGHSLRVGSFKVDRIEPNGDFVAGCHKFRWATIEALAKRYGVTVDGEG